MVVPAWPPPIDLVIEAYAPDLEDAIGGTVANMLEQIHNARNDIAAGKLEQSVDDLFGKPIAYNDAGDFDVNQEAADHFAESGGC